MAGRPEEYTGAWGTNKRQSWTEAVRDPWQKKQKLGAAHIGMVSYADPFAKQLKVGVRRGEHGYVRDRSSMQRVKDNPWFMQGEGGGLLGRRRTEVEGINPQEIYGLSAPSVRKTTEGLISNIEEDASKRNLSPAMAAMARKSLLKGELEGLGSSAGQAAVGAYGMREQGRAGLASMEAGLGTSEMAGRRGAINARIPLKLQGRQFQRADRMQRESQNRLEKFWASYGM